jgi:hypothetical protein
MYQVRALFDNSRAFFDNLCSLSPTNSEQARTKADLSFALGRILALALEEFMKLTTTTTTTTTSTTTSTTPPPSSHDHHQQQHDQNHPKKCSTVEDSKS